MQTNNILTLREPWTPCEELHYKPIQLAKAWGISQWKVIDLFSDEPGVLKMGTRSSRRRTRVSLRIPASVAKRVYERITA